ncbi:hypothetical protein [Pseudodesulfovibrio sp.]|uniref:hypothetical protein n=1 Tax=Pseudodesulfovibrio sp. TaxID=2035812 RepID=UPI00261AEF03|nr:hypothetical protein [Pseudodesulfovibrio sp.]MDD3311336.1 hypothetical protein [Pseudodesulfovibrio sp.]
MWTWWDFASISCGFFSLVFFAGAVLSLKWDAFLLVRLSFGRWGNVCNAAFNVVVGLLNLSLYGSPLYTRSAWYLLFGYAYCGYFFYLLAKLMKGGTKRNDRKN